MLQVAGSPSGSGLPTFNLQPSTFNLAAPLTTIRAPSRRAGYITDYQLLLMLLADTIPTIPWQQVIYVAGGLFGLVGVAGVVLGVVEKGKKVFGRRPPFEEFASRQDLKEQDQLLKHEMRHLGGRLEQQIGDAEI